MSRMRRRHGGAGPVPRWESESWNPLHSSTSPDDSWTTTNVGEAVPGVPTPLSWSLWSYVLDSALRAGAWSIGALDDAERRVPSLISQRHVRIFYGRPALRVQFLAEVGDRMPGTTGREVVRDLFGRVPEGLTFAPTRSRYVHIARRLPRVFLTSPRRVRRLSATTETWWADTIRRIGTMDETAALRTLNDAWKHLDEAVSLQATVLLGVVTPLYNALAALVETTGIGDTAVLSGTGGAEIEVVTDIWRAARGEISLEDVLRRHGFHGPGEGELSSRVWREDPGPLRLLLSEYASRGADADPRLQAVIHGRQREAVAGQLVRALPVHRRPAALLVLRLSARRIPLRGFAKRSFLQSLDVARACSRRIGELLAGSNHIDAADDVFYLTIDELRSPPTDARELIARRRGMRSEYQTLDVPSDWCGNPVTRVLEADAATPDRIKGIGVSPGVVEGRVRVLLEPNFDDVEPDEILVTPYTDPSWSSIMFISAALVVDIGGALSHAAVVARELGIPCVVNTRTGSRTLRTGDVVRVDGGAGMIEIVLRTTDSISGGET